MYDVAVIGGGPAGITSAIYGARAGLKTVIFEGNFFGGQVINSHRVDNYPGLSHISGYEMAEKFFKHLGEFDVDIKNNRVINTVLNGNIKKIYTRKNEFEAKTVIIATGASPRKLGVKGEEEFSGRGVSYCATCDGAFYKDSTVAVIGGGNTAVGDALYLSSVCKKVYIIHRRDEFRADRISVEEMKKRDNIDIIINANVLSITGTDTVKAIELDNGESIDVSGVFIAVGSKPETDIFSDLKKGSNGYILTGENLETNIKGVFAAGDVREKKIKQIITAENDGVLAIDSVLELLKVNMEG